MEQIEAIRNNVEWDRTAQRMPPPEDLAVLAGSQPDAPRYLVASDYGLTAELLRRKGYTWKEVQSWMAKHGADYSIQAVVSGWRTWARQRLGRESSPEIPEY